MATSEKNEKHPKVWVQNPTDADLGYVPPRSWTIVESDDDYDTRVSFRPANCNHTAEEYIRVPEALVVNVKEYL